MSLIGFLYKNKSSRLYLTQENGLMQKIAVSSVEKSGKAVIKKEKQKQRKTAATTTKGVILFL